MISHLYFQIRLLNLLNVFISVLPILAQISSTLWKELTEDGCPGVIDENELKILDKNSDGVIDRTEFVSAVDELHGSHGSVECEHSGGLFQPSQHGAFVFGEWLDLYKQYITQVLQFDPSGGMSGACPLHPPSPVSVRRNSYDIRL